MKPAPLNPQRPRARGSLHPADPVRRQSALVEVLYWIDTRNNREGGLHFMEFPSDGIEVICAEVPSQVGAWVAGWLVEPNEDSYWAGRDNVIVCGRRVQR